MKKTCLLLGILILSLVFASGEVQAENEKPIQLALFSPVQIFSPETPIAGIRLNLLYGKNTTVTGLDWGLVNHTTSGRSVGVQWSFVGLNDEDFLGWQDGFVNITKRDFEGFQSGFVNVAGHCSGFQLGIVNYARSMRGLQIGLVNVIKTGGQFPIFPIVNWSF